MGARSAGNPHAALRCGGGWKRGMAEILGHSQTKERDNGEPKLRPKPARQSSTLHETVSAGACVGVVIYGGVEGGAARPVKLRRPSFRCGRGTDGAAGGDNRPASSPPPSVRDARCGRGGHGSSSRARARGQRRRGPRQFRDSSPRQAVHRGRAASAPSARVVPPAISRGQARAGGRRARAKAAARLQPGSRTVGRGATERRRRLVDPRRYGGGTGSLRARSAAPVRSRQVAARGGGNVPAGLGP